jgi:hypothetical protein
MLTYLFYFFLAYTLYQLVFKFIIPIYRTTRQVKKGFREMQEKMNGQQSGGQHQQAPNSNIKSPASTEGEYIDFEEVKD